MPLGPIFQVVAQAKQAAVPFWDSGVMSQESLPNSNGDTIRVINALYAEHPWDTLTLAGYRMPGLCEIANGLTEIGIDMKKPDGADGSTITIKGYKPGKFEIGCTVWTSDQWTYLQQIIQVVWREKKKKGKLNQIAIDVHHPALQLYGITSCVVEGLTYPQPGKFEGSKVIQFKCIENVPAGKKRVTKTASKTDSARIPVYDSSTIHGLNYTPAPPSTNTSQLGPKGQYATPVNGGT
jgi:hypothetical protein